jgi:hypothetical protein
MIDHLAGDAVAGREILAQIPALPTALPECCVLRFDEAAHRFIVALAAPVPGGDPAPATRLGHQAEPSLPLDGDRGIAPPERVDRELAEDAVVAAGRFVGGEILEVGRSGRATEILAKFEHRRIAIEVLHLGAATLQQTGKIELARTEVEHRAPPQFGSARAVEEVRQDALKVANRLPGLGDVLLLGALNDVNGSAVGQHGVRGDLALRSGCSIGLVDRAGGRTVQVTTAPSSRWFLRRLEAILTAVYPPGMTAVSGVVSRVRRFSDVHGFLLWSFARRHPYQLAFQLAAATAGIAAQGAVLGTALHFLREHRGASHAAAAATDAATSGPSPILSILAWGGLLLVLGGVAAWLDTWAGQLSLRLGRRHARELFLTAEGGLAALTAGTIPAKHRAGGPGVYLARALTEAEALLMRLWIVVLDAVGQTILVPFAFVLLIRSDIRAAALLTLLMLAFGVALYWINIRVVDAARSLADGRGAESSRMSAVAALLVGMRAPNGGDLVGRAMTSSVPSHQLERLLTLRRAVGALRHPFLAAFLALLLAGIAVASDQGQHVWEKALTVAVTVAWISSGLQRVARTVTYMSRILPKVDRLVKLVRSERSSRDADRGPPPRRWRSSGRLDGSLPEAEITADGSTALCWAGTARLSADALADAISEACGRRMSPLAMAIVPRSPPWSSLSESDLLAAWTAGSNAPSDTRSALERRLASWRAIVGEGQATPEAKTLLGAMLTDRSTLAIADLVLRNFPPGAHGVLVGPQRLLLQLIEPSRPAPGGIDLVVVIDESGIAGIGPREWYETVRPALKSKRDANGPSGDDEEENDFDEED